MATPKWQPGKLYAPGSLVVPRTTLPPGAVALQNPGFEAGNDSGWDVEITAQVGAGFVGVRNKDPHDGIYIYAVDGTSGAFHVALTALNQEQPACVPGTIITVKSWARRSTGDPAYVNMVIVWYDAGGVEISRFRGARTSKAETWLQPQASDVAPPLTASVRVGFELEAFGDGDMRVDTVSWNYDSDAPPEGLVFKAVQPKTGYSDNNEPVWPFTLGVQVVDNEVIWEAVLASRVVWQARPILKSGPSEPVWPEVIGERVPDNTIAWDTTSRRIDDPNCPNSEIVVLDENKIYAGDGDLIPFCAVNNPLDWTTPDNAGYLAFGNGKYGGNPVSALGLYRARLMAFNSESMQDWQIDPDPALNHRLNSLPVGSTYHQSYAPFSNDAMLLTAVGFRTLGLAASTSNLSTGDAGTPIDPLILPLVRAGLKPKGIYVPSDGQYWAMFVGTDANPYTPIGASGRWTPSEDGPADYYDFPEIPYDNITLAYVYSVSETGKVGAWSRYFFPFPVEAAVVAGTRLMVRSGNDIIAIDEEFLNDLITDPVEGVGDPGHEVEALLQWAWLEMGGQIGQDKTIEAVDLIGDNGDAPAEISMGWDQRNTAAFTAPYALPYDTVPDEPVAFELTGPTISVKLYYHGGAWKFTALNVYLQDWRLAR